MKQKSVSEFEQQVMIILWERGKCSIRVVYAHLPKEKKVTYSTVATILGRLYKKGLVSKKIKKSICIFSPRISKELYTENIVKTFLNKFVGTFSEVGLASFVKVVNRLPKEKRGYFLSFLENI